MRGLIVMLIALPMMAPKVFAAPIVIKDYGGRDSGVPSEEAVLREYQKTATEAPALDFNPFPIVSKIQQGRLEHPIRLRVPVEKPLFFIGNDAQSRQWLAKNKQYLLSVGASGYATNLQTEAELIDLQEWAKPLSVAPMPLDQAAELFGIPVYPVLMIDESAKQ